MISCYDIMVDTRQSLQFSSGHPWSLVFHPMNASEEMPSHLWTFIYGNLDWFLFLAVKLTCWRRGKNDRRQHAGFVSNAEFMIPMADVGHFCWTGTYIKAFYSLTDLGKSLFKLKLGWIVIVNHRKSIYLCACSDMILLIGSQFCIDCLPLWDFNKGFPSLRKPKSRHSPYIPRVSKVSLSCYTVEQKIMTMPSSGRVFLFLSTSSVPRLVLPRSGHDKL